MYALTCPACDDVRHVPFVRAGAVTRCPACGNQWAIKERQVVRHERRAEVRPAAPEQPPTKEDLGVGGLDDDPKGGSSVSGLSGLSDLMQDVPKPPAPAPPAPAPAASPARTSAGGAARASASGAPSPAATPAAASAPAAAGAGGRPRGGIVVAVAVAAVLGLLGWALFGGGGAPSSPAGDTSGPTPAAGGSPAAADPAAIDPAGPPAPEQNGP